MANITDHEKADGVQHIDVSASESVFDSVEHRQFLLENINRLRIDSGYTDITIKIESVLYPCHKVILAAGSPYFRTMFSSGMEESWKDVIEMKQIDPMVFGQVLKFIYSGTVEIGGATVQDLFTQAHQFQISPLVELCVSFFQECMNEGNCLAAMTLAESHGHRPMYEFAKTFACKHFATVVEDDDFLRMSVECIIDLLTDRRLNCTREEEVFEAAISWLEHAPDHRGSYTSRVLKCIKFPLIDRSYLMDVVARKKYLTGDEGRELLEAAVLYHTVPSRRHILPSYQITPRMSFPYIECAVLLGGRLGEGLSNDVECYRTDTKEFMALKQLPFKKRNEFAACSIGDEIFVSGGLRSAEFWKYDPTFESWLRGANMLQARRRHAMAAVDETIYVLGGFDEENVLDSVEVWERNSNKWETCGNLVTAVENMGFTAYGKKIFLFGGKNTEELVTNLVQCFDTTTCECTQLTQCLPANDMCISAAVLNNKIYVVGLEGFFVYSPSADQWEVLPDMKLPRDFVSLCVLDEKLYAFGGRRRGAKDNLYSDAIEVFDVKNLSWVQVGTTPVPMYSYGCVRVFLSRPLYGCKLAKAGGDGVGPVRSSIQVQS